MEIRLLRLSALVALLLIVLAPAAQGKTQTTTAATPSPTAAQVRAAVTKAERSPDLWATVNVCNTKKHPNTIGIRGQLPTLGFSAQLRMRFGVEYWTGRAFTPLRGLEKSVALGAPATGLKQDGWMFPFRPHAGRLRGSVIFEWRLHRRLIGHAKRLTRSHHRSADYGDPRGFSSTQCVIP
jgi:hypothetical protein